MQHFFIQVFHVKQEAGKVHLIVVIYKRDGMMINVQNVVWSKHATQVNSNFNTTFIYTEIVNKIALKAAIIVKLKYREI
jgi:hypothetical protein